jgi:crotonobetainyl-CoA:carnitine CoA-transferase CaiB-like acyl-CoA transferase
MSVLRGIRVVEFAQGVAGPLVAARLAQLGASVIKVERRQGDWMRQAAPAVPNGDTSAAFFELNAGKRSLRLGDAPEQAAPVLRALLARADIFITDRPREALLALGLDASLFDTYQPNPGLICVTLNAWGAAGPWRARKGSELTAQAVAGYTRYLGAQGQPACRIGADVAGAGTAIFAGQAILAALYARRRNGGKGQHVSLSLLNTLLALKSVHLAAQSNPEQYAGARVGGSHYPPERGWRTNKGNLFFAFGGSVGKGRPGWVGFVEEAGFTRLLDDPRFDKSGRNSAGYGVDAPALKPEYEREFARYDAEELAQMIRRHGGNAATYQRVDEALSHPQTQALDLLREVQVTPSSPAASITATLAADAPAPQPGANGTAPAQPTASANRTRVRAFPARFSRTQPQAYGLAPALGQHTREIVLEYGFDLAAVNAMVDEKGLAVD